MNNVFLLVDDDCDDAELFCEALGEIAPAVKCYSAANGHEAFRILNTIPVPDVIFLDINMPVMNGWECLEKLKALPEYRSIPVIIYSTSSHKKDLDRAIATGAASFLSKPHDYRELKRELQEVIAHIDASFIIDRGSTLKSD